MAFGFRIDGLPADAFTPSDQPDWPELHVEHRVAAAPPGPRHLSDSSARLSLGEGGWLLLDRAARSATYLTGAAVDADSLVHPYLAPAAALMARWLGREAFHAGAFVVDGEAWAVAGSNEAGKSTLLARLALAGTPVLSDDLLVLHDGRVYAGPRCIDLREPAVAGDRVRGRVRPVRDGTRHRLALDAAPAVARLRGWFLLEWGSSVEAVPCRAPARIERLLAQRRWAADPIDPRVLLELSSLPAWELRRPRGAAHMDAVLRCISEVTQASR